MHAGEFGPLGFNPAALCWDSFSVFHSYAGGNRKAKWLLCVRNQSYYVWLLFSTLVQPGHHVVMLDILAHTIWSGTPLCGRALDCTSWALSEARTRPHAYLLIKIGRVESTIKHTACWPYTAQLLIAGRREEEKRNRVKVIGRNWRLFNCVAFWCI